MNSLTNPKFTRLTRFWILYPSEEFGACPGPTAIHLQFLTYIIVTAGWSLILGNRIFRKYVYESINRCIPQKWDWSFAKKERNLSQRKQFQHTLAVLFSATCQVTATIVSAALLRRENHNIPFRYPLLAWLTRPLPGVVVVWTSMIDMQLYSVNAREFFYAEVLYGFISIYTFGDVANNTRIVAADKDLHKTLGTDKIWLLGFTMVRAGSAVGLLQCIVGLLLGIYWHHLRNYLSSPKTMIWILMMGRCVFHFLCCWSIWVGMLLMDPLMFCPSRRAIKDLALLWAFVPVVDHFGRALMMRTGLNPEDRRQEDSYELH